MAIRFNRTALVAGVKGQEAAAFAAEISTYRERAWACPPRGACSWVARTGWCTGSPTIADMAEFEAGLVKTLTDPGYLAILAKAEGLFIEGSTKDTIVYMM